MAGCRDCRSPTLTIGQGGKHLTWVATGLARTEDTGLLITASPTARAAVKWVPQKVGANTAALRGPGGAVIHHADSLVAVRG